MQSVFSPLTKPTVIRFSKLDLIKNELCMARACFYCIHTVQLRQTKLENAVVKLTKLDLIFFTCRTIKSYNFDTELTNVHSFQISCLNKLLSVS